MLAARSAQYVVASRLLGASGVRVLFTDIRPNAAGPVLVLAALDIGNAVLLLSGLSFLGLGAQPPTAEWGAMVAEAAVPLSSVQSASVNAAALLGIGDHVRADQAGLRGRLRCGGRRPAGRPGRDADDLAGGAGRPRDPGRRRVRFSVRVNNDLPFAELLALAAAAERAGFDQLWFSNDLFLRSAPVLAGALAASTGRIGLGIAVMNPYSVHVSELAMVAATAQEISGGRFLLGLGAGAEQFLGWAGPGWPGRGRWP